jgi:hypothetical protein
MPFNFPSIYPFLKHPGLSGYRIFRITSFFFSKYSLRLQRVWLEGAGVREWEFGRCGAKSPLIGLWEWEFLREGDRELTRSTPADIFPGRGR